MYRQTGGHAYGWTYSGPIGSIIAPGMLGLADALPLPFASSLCGACEDVCPVRIPIPDLLVAWREAAVAEGLGDAASSLAVKSLAVAAERPSLFQLGGAGLRIAPWRTFSKSLPVLNGWSQEREPPRPSPKTFRQLWREGIE